MINNVMSGASLTAAPVVSPRYAFSVADAGTKMLTAIAVLLLMPAMLVVGLVAILVPCFLSVPVCGPEIRAPRATAKR
jgi:hypothetical protein